MAGGTSKVCEKCGFRKARTLAFDCDTNTIKHVCARCVYTFPYKGPAPIPMGETPSIGPNEGFCAAYRDDGFL